MIDTFKISLSSFDPYEIESIRPWYSKLTFPNGVKIKNNALYITDFNKLKKVTLTEGGIPGDLKVLYQSVHLFLDFPRYPSHRVCTL